MSNSPFLPVFELTRGGTVESVHFGAAAVVDAAGRLIAWYGDPEAVTFLRSSAKPFQALPFFEKNGPDYFHFSLPEQAILCASHSGTDMHLATVQSIQAKAGFDEAELLCGVHEPFHKPTADRIRDFKETLSANRHNCSGKHSGMLAYVRLKVQQGEFVPQEVEYIDPSHPIQVEILRTFSEMCDVPVERIGLGIDGCSAPNFAIPLRSAALAYARLCDPITGHVQPETRVEACRKITAAMMANPEMVGGPGRFDTHLMEVGQGKILSKAGAEAYQGIGLMPGAIGPGSPAMGIALKISDGDDRKKARTAVAMEILRQLGALSEVQMNALLEFGPEYKLENWRKIAIGHAYPKFQLVQPVLTQENSM
jgi:L-asparaginase II